MWTYRLTTSRALDQAVKSLCETWHPDDIPPAFTACAREALCAQPDLPIPPAEPHPPPNASLIANGLSTLFAHGNTQLPSPVSPTSCQTPSPPGDRCESYSQAPGGSGSSNLIPIKGFVHEVLRRSRTSTGVLQTALCYLEAVRSKVPELLRSEKACPSAERLPEPAPEPRIVQGVFEECDSPDLAPYVTPSDAPDKTAGPTLQSIRGGDTVLVTNLDTAPPAPVNEVRSKEEEQVLPPLPPLPSPLCCPRRTFLACLILASKFMQDRSYSNRAWAKLAGLPPREIGRCERALGEALEWRLWVGKLPSTSTGTRTVSRSKSEGNILSGPDRTCSSSSTAAWAASPTAGAPASSSQHAFACIPPSVSVARSRTRGLQRCATVPAAGTDRSSAYAEPSFAPTPSIYYYGTRAAPGMGDESTMDVELQIEVSPSMSTPTLTYSPMSTASSSSDGSEERTIQMSMMDFPTPSISYGAYMGSGGPWVASQSTYTPADPANPNGSYGTFGAIHNPYFNVYNLPSGEVDHTESQGPPGQALSMVDAEAAKWGFTSALSFSEVFNPSCPGVSGMDVQ
ncbi:hypothetical protein K466DRAFT_477987 [Polyporus arcularius HHB13444]|uniref:Cyclin N-terminal domain-containing protein n=1 Tax=Polyporus arcularius HHB13444 TaxID=1314778 RepID=A0A5C3PVA0_9APHY|nr:hypothetical protein K466DRAFT_477987 [Polyporus arcularius HHB13444]